MFDNYQIHTSLLKHWYNAIFIPQQCQVTTGGSIFSSCVVINDSREQPIKFRIFCGSHDQHIYCWNENLELEWKTFLGGEVYAVPFCHQLSSRSGDKEWYVSVPTTEGRLFTLDSKTGVVVSHLQLPGELFSSPVAMSNRLVVGCRDDYLYCVDISVEWIKEQNMGIF